jgi:hypothetical protein
LHALGDIAACGFGPVMHDLAVSIAWPVAELVSIDRDDAHPRRITARLRVGGCPCQVTLDFGTFPGAAQYIAAPRLVDVHHPTMRAVVSLLRDADEGRPAVPGDLTSAIRAAAVRWNTEPSPFERVTLIAHAIDGERTTLDFRADGDPSVRRLVFTTRQRSQQSTTVAVDDPGAFQALSKPAAGGLIALLRHVRAEAADGRG